MKLQAMRQELLLFIVWMVAAVVLPASFAVGTETADSPIKELKKELTLPAKRQSLADILDFIHRECGVKVMGVEDREGELISFQARNEPVEKALKRLLRQLNETNYAFVYSRTRLKHVAVYPNGGGKRSYDPAPVPVPAATALPSRRPESEKVVKVLKVNEGTQAESVDIQVGDLVVEYDGARIKSAQELVRSVKKKSPEETVEMVLVRGGDPIRVLLNGGLIGINIRTVSVPKSELSTVIY